ncbi:MAG TPA: GNAT family N-acetyltransferase [Sporichthya sp.]|nr:GNAT family N-acetyltransferase [Sporichthya sp.]
MNIRDATEADWPEIWSFFQPIMAAGETYTVDRDISEPEARAGWLPPHARVFVAVEAGRVVGTAKLVRNFGGPAAHVANASFVVDPAAAGRGIGRALGEHVLAAARAAGYRAMQFNAVVETNTGAVALWRSLGFDILTTVPEAFDHPGQGLVGLHVMYRAL